MGGFRKFATGQVGASDQGNRALRGLIRSPDSIVGSFLKGSFWLGCSAGMPLTGSAEVMILKGTRNVHEFWSDQFWLGVSMLALLLVGGTFNAARAALYKLAYDKVK
jgi:hypothetical protein